MFVCIGLKKLHHVYIHTYINILVNKSVNKRTREVAVMRERRSVCYTTVLMRENEMLRFILQIIQQ